MKAVIDIGSNSVLLLLAERAADGQLTIHEDRATVCRLSQGVSRTGHLADAAIERTLACLADYRARAEAAGARLEAVATEGLRMASDAERFLGPAAQVLGHPVRIISGDEEARLSYRSVALEEGGGPLRVIDIGGASTELVVGEGLEVQDARSHAIGSVRLTERHVRAPTQPVPADAIAAIDADARRALSAQPVAPHPVLHGLAGTVTTCAALLLELEVYNRDRVHGASFERAAVVALRDRMAALPMAGRVGPVLAEGRADVIVAGLTILLAALDHCGAHTLAVRDRGLRYALL